MCLLHKRMNIDYFRRHANNKINKIINFIRKKILLCNTIMNPQQFYDNRVDANIDSLNNVLSYTQ